MAFVGDVVAPELAHELKVRAGGVIGLFTVNVKEDDVTPVPALGVAVSVPAYVPAVVDDDTTTLPQLTVFAAQLAGPAVVVLAGPP